jgi:hypothetical protein
MKNISEQIYPEFYQKGNLEKGLFQRISLLLQDPVYFLTTLGFHSLWFDDRQFC